MSKSYSGARARRRACPPGTLRTRVHYGLRRLRCALETADAAA
jgi:DNA-directed RNA polymerase specialized sigma24 family protein